MTRWWARLRPILVLERASIGTALALASVGAAIDLLRPWTLKLLVDHALARAPLPRWADWLAALPGAASPGGLVVWLCASTVGFFAARQAVTVAQAYVEEGLAGRLTMSLGTRTFD